MEEEEQGGRGHRDHQEGSRKRAISHAKLGGAEKAGVSVSHWREPATRRGVGGKEPRGVARAEAVRSRLP